MFINGINLQCLQYTISMIGDEVLRFVCMVEGGGDNKHKNSLLCMVNKCQVMV